MSPSVEILVHISGPSRGPDDARYRREVQGLQEFEPAERHEIISLHESEETRDAKGDGLQRYYGRERGVTFKALDDSIDRFQSEDAEEDTVYRGTVTSSTDTSQSDPVASNITKKKPSPHILIERTPAFPRRHTTSAAAGGAARGAAEESAHPTTSRPSDNHHHTSRSDSWKTPPSVIPDSQPSLLPPSSSNSIGKPQAISSSPCLLKRPFAPSNSSSSPSPGKRYDDDDHHHASSQKKGKRKSKRQRVEDHSAGEAHSAPAPAASGSGASSDGHHPSNSRPLPVPWCPPGSWEIHPPRPLTSNSPFKSHLTPSLLTISTHLPLAKYFIPTIQSQLRPLAELERGHWFFVLDKWEESVKEKFWRFLTRFVGEGRAGWGVWCCCERGVVDHVQRGDGVDDLSDDDGGSSSGSDDDDGGGGDGESSGKENRDPLITLPTSTIINPTTTTTTTTTTTPLHPATTTRDQQLHCRLYCWGEIVGEIWLLLFIASERRIKGVGARWIDAEGKSVVVMK